MSEERRIEPEDATYTRFRSIKSINQELEQMIVEISEVKAINTNLTNDVKKIKCPTLLIWGELDTAVPVKRAYELEKLIKDAGVVVYKDATHYAYLERLNEVILVLDSFLKVRR